MRLQHLRHAEILLRDQPTMPLLRQADELERLVKAIGALAKRCVSANRREGQS